VDHIRLSLEDLLSLFRHVFIGKLVRGFIHNLNGPLHAFGIEMDMIGHLLLNRRDNGPQFMDRLQSRLQRMEEEFDRMTGLIRTTTEGMDLNELASVFFHLNAFIQHQMTFLKADLYFKHHVEVDLRLTPDLAVIRDPETNPALGLVWLMQAVIEEMEQAKLRKLQLETSMVGSGQSLRFYFEEGALSEEFRGALQSAVEGTKDPVIRSNQLGAYLSFRHLLSQGALIRCDTHPSGTSLEVVLRQPAQK
jgi:signal transduction histidine kinase